MTHLHPLTDEIIHAKQLGYTDDYGNRFFDVSDMRAGADWQLEQVIQFLEANKDLSVKTALRFIRPAMRPQQQS